MEKGRVDGAWAEVRARVPLAVNLFSFHIVHEVMILTARRLRMSGMIVNM